MNENIRVLGWIILGIGFLLIAWGLLSFSSLVHVKIDLMGVDLDTIQERIAWIVCWFVVAVTGGLFVRLTQPKTNNHVPDM